MLEEFNRLPVVNGLARPMPGDNLPAWVTSWVPESDWLGVPFPGSRTAYFNDDSTHGG